MNIIEFSQIVRNSDGKIIATCSDWQIANQKVKELGYSSREVSVINKKVKIIENNDLQYPLPTVRYQLYYNPDNGVVTSEQTFSIEPMETVHEGIVMIGSGWWVVESTISFKDCMKMVKTLKEKEPDRRYEMKFYNGKGGLMDEEVNMLSKEYILS